MMRSAADFLPLFMMTFMNLASMSLLNFGSGRIVRTGAWARRLMADSRDGLYPAGDSLLRALGAVFGTRLLALADPGAIQGPAHCVITHSGQVLHAAAANEHHRVLLEVVPLAPDVAGDLISIGQANAAYLPECRIWLL